MEKVKIPNSKGQNIAAVIHRPEKSSGRLAILCPGNVDSKDYTHLVELANVLAREGYTAVRFDPTGTWESEGEIADYSVTQYLKDVKSVLEYMQEREKFSFVLLGGHSMGGYISMLYGSKDSRISLVLNIMGPYSTRRSSKEILDAWKKEGFKTSLRDIPGSNDEREFHVPYSYIEDRLRYNVLDEIKNLKVPLIIVAGELDTTVPGEDTKLIFDTANEPKKYIVIPRIGHNYRRNLSEIKIVNDVILETLRKMYEHK